MPAPTPAPSPPGPEDAVRILEWVVSNNVSLYREKTEPLIAPTQAEEGNVHFDMYEDTDPTDSQTRIWQYLVFKDKSAHTFHLNTDVVKTWIEEVINPGTLTTPNRSELVFMKSLKVDDPIAICVKELPGVHVINALFLPADQNRLRAAALDLYEPIRNMSGVLYHELLVPGNSSERVFGDVTEIMWLKDEAALTAVRNSAAWTNFTTTMGANLTQVETKPKNYAAMTVCGQASMVI